VCVCVCVYEGFPTLRFRDSSKIPLECIWTCFCRAGWRSTVPNTSISSLRLHHDLFIIHCHLSLARALSLSLCKKITHVSMKEKQQTNRQAVWSWYLTRPYLWCRAKAQRLWGTFSFLCRVLLMTALALTKHEFDRCITDHISTHTDSLTKTSQCIHIFINMCPHTRTYSHTNTPHSIHVYVSRTSDSEQQSMNTCIWIVMWIFIWGWGVYMWFVCPYEAGVCTCEASSCLVYFGSRWLQLAAFFIPLTRHASLTFAQFRKIRKVQKIKRERERREYCGLKIY
jgi:hypothetical protein